MSLNIVIFFNQATVVFYCDSIYTGGSLGESIKYTKQPHIKRIQGYLWDAVALSASYSLTDPQYSLNITDKKDQKVHPPPIWLVYLTLIRSGLRPSFWRAWLSLSGYLRFST